MHITVKYAFTKNSQLTNFDSLLFIGLWISPFYLICSFLKGVSLNIFKFSYKSSAFILLRVLAGTLLNVFLFAGMQYISVSKSTLVYNTNPIWCMLMAVFILGEKWSFFTLLSSVGAFFGIYMLTLNRQDAGGDSRATIFGYF
jgi:drug/metabolite transporter (DMT)-like permease